MSKIDVGPTASTREGPALRRRPLRAHELAALRLRDGVAFARGELRTHGAVDDVTWSELFDRLDDLIDALPDDPRPTRATTPWRGPSPSVCGVDGTR